MSGVTHILGRSRAIACLGAYLNFVSFGVHGQRKLSSSVRPFSKAGLPPWLIRAHNRRKTVLLAFSGITKCTTAQTISSTISRRGLARNMARKSIPFVYYLLVLCWWTGFRVWHINFVIFLASGAAAECTCSTSQIRKPQTGTTVTNMTLLSVRIPTASIYLSEIVWGNSCVVLHRLSR